MAGRVGGEWNRRSQSSLVPGGWFLVVCTTKKKNWVVHTINLLSAVKARFNYKGNLFVIRCKLAIANANARMSNPPIEKMLYVTFCLELSHNLIHRKYNLNTYSF
jgi:hypothetical protein